MHMMLTSHKETMIVVLMIMCTGCYGACLRASRQQSLQVDLVPARVLSGLKRAHSVILAFHMWPVIAVVIQRNVCV